MSIDRIASTLPAPSTASTPPGASGASAGFSEALGDLLGAVDGTTTEANEAVSRMLNGTGDVHEAMIALQKADVMLQLAVQVRNKLVQAYQEVMRMPV
jgi:flagellar hook-basal body complex protein FliE